MQGLKHKEGQLNSTVARYPQLLTSQSFSAAMQSLVGELASLQASSKALKRCIQPFVHATLTLLTHDPMSIKAHTLSCNVLGGDLDGALQRAADSLKAATEVGCCVCSLSNSQTAVVVHVI